jgi:hypothetical protein
MPSSPSSERPPAHLPRGFGERPTTIDISRSNERAIQGTDLDSGYNV